MSNQTISTIPVLATQINDSDLFEKADGPAAGQSQRVPASLLKTYLPSYFNLVGVAYIGGDQTGNARSTFCLDIQSGRTTVAQVASMPYAIAVGYANTSSGTPSVSLGKSCTASATGTIAIGSSVSASGPNAIAIGTSSTAGTSSCIAIGNGAQASGGSNGIAIGTSTAANNINCIAIGTSCSTSSTYGVAIGYGCSAAASKAMAIGYQLSNGGANSIKIGILNTFFYMTTTDVSFFSATSSIFQVLKDTLGHNGSTLRLQSSDTGSDMYLHITSAGVITATSTP